MQEQTLAGGTAGLRTWVHLTQRSPGRGMGTYQPGPDKRKEVGTQGLVSRFGTTRNLSGNGKCLGGGRFPRRGKFPREECLLLTGLGTRMCLPSRSSQGRWDGLPCLLMGGQSVVSASSRRLVLSFRLHR